MIALPIIAFTGLALLVFGSLIMGGGGLYEKSEDDRWNEARQEKAERELEEMRRAKEDAE